MSSDEAASTDDDYSLVLTTDDGGMRHVTVRIVFGWPDVSGLWSEERWREFATRDQGKPFEMSATHPTLSRLAYMDEGSLQLNAADVVAECQSALPVTHDARARSFLQRLFEAATNAVESGALMWIGPSFGESVGDQYSYPLLMR